MRFGRPRVEPMRSSRARGVHRLPSASGRSGPMGILSCSWCGHDGAHASVMLTDESGVKRCTGCPKCYPQGYPPPPQPPHHPSVSATFRTTSD